MAQWIAMSGKGIEGFQHLMGAAMGAPPAAPKKK